MLTISTGLCFLLLLCTGHWAIPTVANGLLDNIDHFLTSHLSAKAHKIQGQEQKNSLYQDALGLCMMGLTIASLRASLQIALFLLATQQTSGLTYASQPPSGILGKYLSCEQTEGSDTSLIVTTGVQFSKDSIPNVPVIATFPAPIELVEGKNDLNRVKYLSASSVYISLQPGQHMAGTMVRFKGEHKYRCENHVVVPPIDMEKMFHLHQGPALASSASSLLTTPDTTATTAIQSGSGDLASPGPNVAKVEVRSSVTPQVNTVTTRSQSSMDASSSTPLAKGPYDGIPLVTPPIIKDGTSKTVPAASSQLVISAGSVAPASPHASGVIGLERFITCHPGKGANDPFDISIGVTFAKSEIPKGPVVAKFPTSIQLVPGKSSNNFAQALGTDSVQFVPKPDSDNAITVRFVGKHDYKCQDFMVVPPIKADRLYQLAAAAGSPATKNDITPDSLLMGESPSSSVGGKYVGIADSGGPTGQIGEEIETDIGSAAVEDTAVGDVSIKKVSQPTPNPEFTLPVASAAPTSYTASVIVGEQDKCWESRRGAATIVRAALSPMPRKELGLPVMKLSFSTPVIFESVWGGTAINHVSSPTTCLSLTLQEYQPSVGAVIIIPDAKCDASGAISVKLAKPTVSFSPGDNSSPSSPPAAVVVSETRPPASPSPVPAQASSPAELLGSKVQPQGQPIDIATSSVITAGPMAQTSYNGSAWLDNSSGPEKKFRRLR